MVKPFTWKTFEFLLSKLLHRGKTFFFGAIFLPLSKTFISSWLNLYKLEKLIIFPG
jgi:hypothetical protein